MKYVTYILYYMNIRHVNKNPVRTIMKTYPYEELDIDEGESVKDEG